jgi:hypothetical protein
MNGVASRKHAFSNYFQTVRCRLSVICWDYGQRHSSGLSDGSKRDKSRRCERCGPTLPSGKICRRCCALTTTLRLSTPGSTTPISRIANISLRPQPMRPRTVAARMAATITNLLRNKGYDDPDSRANKNKLYVQTDVRRLRRTTRFEHNGRNDAQTRSCPRKRE